MYTATCTSAGAAGACTLAHTGFGAGFIAVAGFTLVMAGMAVLNLLPRRQH